MKKILLLSFLLLFSLSACAALGNNAADTPAEVVEIDVDATVEAGASTKAAETVEALATPTREATATLEPSPTSTATEAATETPSPTETAEAADEETTGTPGTPEGSGTPEAEDAATATLKEGEDTPTPTATETAPESTATSIYPSPTSPIVANDAPDYIPRYKVKVRNNTKVRVYISLQGSTEGGYHPIIEYDLAPFQKIKLTVPEGYYAVVVYVGNDPMVEYVGIHSSNAVEIQIEKDNIKIK